MAGLGDGGGIASSGRSHFQFLEHEGEQVIPTREVEIARESAQIIEEVAPCAQGMPNRLIHCTSEMQRRVKEKGQEQHREQHC